MAEPAPLPRMIVAKFVDWNDTWWLMRVLIGGGGREPAGLVVELPAEAD